MSRSRKAGTDTDRNGLNVRNTNAATEPHAGGLRLGKMNSIFQVPALIFAAAALLSLTVRPISGADLGYHLAYGTRFLDSGHIVDDASFIHPVPNADNANTDSLPLAPGAFFDADGKYHFPNANWLSQVILALIWRGFGWTGLNAALAGLVAMIAAAQYIAVRRLGISAWYAAVCWLVLAMVGHERFLLRPELFAFAILCWQFALLADGKFSKKSVIAVLILQLLAANLHSYWLLGAFIVGAFWLDSLIKLAVSRYKNRGKITDQHDRGLFIRRGVCLLLMILAACFHPGGPANLLYPIKTLSYVSAHQISGLDREQVAERMLNRDSAEKPWHPWQTIGEFHSPFSPESKRHLAAKSFMALLALSVVTLAAAAWRQNWAMFAITAAFIAASLGMRRNMILPALLVPSIAAWSIINLLKKTNTRNENTTPATPATPPPATPASPATPATPAFKLKLTMAICSVIIAASAILIWSVVSNRFYTSSGRMLYFGLGPSPVTMPLGACEALDRLLSEPQPVFVNQNTSSAVVFFSEKASAAPTLTNTWAMPPIFMARSIDICVGRADAGQITEMGFGAAVLQGWAENAPLIDYMLQSPDWILVNIDGWHCTFIDRNSADSAKLARAALTQQSLTPADILAELPKNPAARTIRLKATASMLQIMKWHYHAARLWSAYRETPSGAKDPKAWRNGGICLRFHGLQLLWENNFTGLDILRQARKCFIRALEIDGSYALAADDLRQVDRDLSVLSPTGR